MASSGSFNTGKVGNFYITFSWSRASYSIPNNTSTIEWEYVAHNTEGMYRTVWQRKLVINGATVHSSSSDKTAYDGTVLARGTTTITHNTDGTKTFSASGSAGVGQESTNSSGSGSWELPTIPRASSVSGGSGNIGSTATINISRASSGFTHTLKYSFGSASGTIATSVGTSYTWTIPKGLYAQIPNANSGTGTITCDTYNGSTKIGTSTCSFTAKVTSSNPTFSASNLSYLDTNTTVVGITGNNQHIVRNQSSLRVAFTGATALNSASISKYDVTLNGVTQTKTSASTIEYGKLNVSSNLTLTIKVTDSRGNITTATKTITVIDWVVPTANISLKRLNNYEDTTYLKVVGTISSVNSKNAIQSIKYKYKQTTGTTYGSEVSINNNQQYTLTMNKQYAWNFEVTITDKFGTKTYSLTLAKGMPIMFLDTDKLSVGINCFPTKSNSFELNGKTIFDLIYPVGSIYIRNKNTNPSDLFGGTWVLVFKKCSEREGSNGFTMNTTNCSASSNAWHLHNNVLTMDISMTNKVAWNDTTVSCGTINLANIGITRIAHNIYPTAPSDGNNAIGIFYVAYNTGIVEARDCTLGRNTVMAVGTAPRFTFCQSLNWNWLNDSICDEWHWRRTA